MGRSHLVSLGPSSWPLTWLYLTFGRATRGHVLDFWKRSKNKEIQKSSTSGTLAPCNASGPPMWLPMNVKSKPTQPQVFTYLTFGTRDKTYLSKSQVLCTSIPIQCHCVPMSVPLRFHIDSTHLSLRVHCNSTAIKL